MHCQYCTIVYYIWHVLLQCNVLYCIVLHCTVLYCPTHPLSAPCLLCTPHTHTLAARPPPPQVNREVTSWYTYACQDIAQTCRSPEHHNGALLHMTSNHAHAVLFICKPSAHNTRAAVGHICRLDPGSTGVGFSKVVPLALDVWAGNLVGQLNGVDAVGAATPGWMW